MDLVEARLQAPLLFDDATGYWTGEPNTALLETALAASKLPPNVQVVRDGAQVTLRGRRSAVDKALDVLTAAGLEKQEP